VHKATRDLTALVLRAAKRARAESGGAPEPEPDLTRRVRWPVPCTVGPGLEGAIACESKIGYVNGSRGCLIYRGYDIFDLCAHSTYEEVSYLLLHGKLPTARQLAAFQETLTAYRRVPGTLRTLMNFMVEKMTAMGAVRLGTNLMRQEFTTRDFEDAAPEPVVIGADEDSIPMETRPRGERHAIYEFYRQGRRKRAIKRAADDASSLESCTHLIAGIATIAAAIARIRRGLMPIEPDPGLGHAANFLYMITGRRPTPVEERVMDIALILHADHGMNASTFAAMVVASTLSDIYFSVGSGVAALNGPLHGGANEKVIGMLRRIGSPKRVPAYVARAGRRKEKIMGFGHRVYKAYDPRARILAPLVDRLAREKPEMRPLLRTAKALEKEVVAALGHKKIFPNVDFYSGLLYACLEIPEPLFTPTFAVARVAGWTSRVLEYLRHNRIFRPRAMYVGPFDQRYVPIERRGAARR
jgi:citrate synthase